MSKDCLELLLSQEARVLPPQPLTDTAIGGDLESSTAKHKDVPGSAPTSLLALCPQFKHWEDEQR